MEWTEQKDVMLAREILDGNLLSWPQPEAVLAPVSYRSSRRRRQRKRLLLKVPNESSRTALECALHFDCSAEKKFKF